jgi:hypothetical protein
MFTASEYIAVLRSSKAQEIAAAIYQSCNDIKSAMLSLTRDRAGREQKEKSRN